MELTKREVIIFSLYKQFILNNSKCECVRRDRHCRWWQQKVFFFFSKFWLLYLFCLIANGTDKLNFLKRLLAIPEIPTWLCCFLPGSTHSLHVSHKFYTIPVIVLLVSKPSLYRLNWTSWRLRNNRLLWNAYCNLLRHILSKHNRHQYKIMIHRWLCLFLC